MRCTTTGTVAPGAAGEAPLFCNGANLVQEHVRLRVLCLLPVHVALFVYRQQKEDKEDVDSNRPHSPTATSKNVQYMKVPRTGQSE